MILEKDKWKNIPDNYVSVYHHTNLDNLEKISKKGIIPYGEKDITEGNFADNSRMEVRKITDQEMDKFAKEYGYDFSRAKSFYCSPNSGEDWNQSNINLEIKIDPDKVSVFDADLATAVVVGWARTKEGQRWFNEHPEFPEGKNREEFFKKLKEEDYFPDKLENYTRKYWLSGMKLKDFLNLSKEEQINKFKSPEILVPFFVDKNFIRINK